MPTDQAVNPMMQFVPFILIMIIFYFLVIKPQKEKQKQLQESLKTLAKNDQVVTSSGIHGTVVLIKDKTVMLRVDDNVKIEFDKEAIVTIEKVKS
jgi:preprotein translocase subunit YajC